MGIKRFRQGGFTIIELLVVIIILGILMTLVVINLNSARQRAYLTRAKGEFNIMRTAMQLYLEDNGDYPPDANRDIPPGLEDYLQPKDLDRWPNAPWPGSVYDYDVGTNGGETYYQISIRFCPLNSPSQCKYPNTDWAENFQPNSSVYYCFEGPCKPHPSQAANYPGYCVNCTND